MDLLKDFLWPICNLLLILVIYFVRHWTDQHLVVGALGLLALPCFLVLPESPRHSVIFSLKKNNIFLQFPHQIDMKNHVRCCKNFSWYSTTLIILVGSFQIFWSEFFRFLSKLYLLCTRETYREG